MLRTFVVSSLLLVAAVAMVVIPSSEPAHAAEVTWDIEMKGKSRTMGGDKFPFSGEGTMTWDQVTGVVTFALTTPAGPWNGAGTMAVADNGKTVYGLVTFQAGGGDASAIFSGKLKKKGERFAGKFQAASPTRLGPTPGGFVLTTGKVKGETQ